MQWKQCAPYVPGGESVLSAVTVKGRAARLVRPLDVPIVLVGLAVAASAWFAGPEQEATDTPAVSVSVSGRVVKTWPLPSEAGVRRDTISGALGPLVTESDERGVRVVSSNCPHKLCVEFGSLSTARGGIVCAPNAVLITLDGGDSHKGTVGTVDGVTQ